MASEISRKGIEQKSLARDAHCDPSVVSRLLNGRRPPISPTVREIAHRIGSAKVWLALTYEATSGIFTAPWPDGPVASVDPAATFLKAVAEDREDDDAKERLAEYLTRQPESISETEKAEAQRLLLHVVDELRADAVLIAAVCDALGIDVVKLFAEHDRKLAANGAIAARRVA